ncbi:MULTISPECIES: ATP-binding cassette domain-containing protein [Pseudoalteromonas]|uniref:Molybdate transport system ATP-binding protein n=1 Tax=Pseudoalteromonas agarivorans DSM 14585 TaxID=1312369 RepID=A0ACA8DX19_9GAMM|nr:ATP-binding cassette domain-containing protein [Pseudoalteromonas agarivorans]ATC82563.1 molybdate transport system ATP-binding protein [Pseudoalteromonas agarivorans DSM 14585]MCK8094486.1 ATP-binding cassette domain-containing protein [Pseudoalteromonas sp. 1CM17D]
MLKIQCHQRLDDFELHVDLAINQFDILGVFGPSGSGKSSLLQAIAGLTTAQNVCINNHNITHLKPDKRLLTLQLQSCPLFPHLNVMGNLLFTHKHCKNKSNNLTPDQVIDLLALNPLLNRDVSGLSGGERQRVIFARTLLSGQSVVLLDEPFSALDWSTRFTMLGAIQQLNKSHGIKFIIVSHSLKELLYCSDTLLHIAKGSVLQCGATQEVVQSIYTNKSQTPLSILSYSKPEFNDAFGLYQLTLSNSQQHLYAVPSLVKQNHKLIIESSQITYNKVKPINESSANVLIGILENAQQLDEQWLLTVNVDTQLLYCAVSKRQWQQSAVSLGEQIYLTINNLETLN